MYKIKFGDKWKNLRLDWVSVNVRELLILLNMVMVPWLNKRISLIWRGGMHAEVYRDPVP